MPSKLHYDDFDQDEISMVFSQAICKVEENEGHHRTVVIGDFNMNPFDRGMISARAFNAVRPIGLAQENSRVLDSFERRYFYNPMWNFFSERAESPPGTFFHSSPGGKSIHWNILDQVLIRPQLLPKFNLDDVSIISKTDAGPLINEKGRPNLSDHLPISINIKN